MPRDREKINCKDGTQGVHNVLVASAHGARTGVSCGSTRSKKWHNLGSVNLCKNCRNSANKASGRCFRFRTLTSSMRWSNTYVTLACPSLACPLPSGKPKEWCPLPVSPYTSSFHILSDVLLTLTSPRWLCIILIYNTPLDLWSLWRPTPGPNGDQTPSRHSKRILPLFRVPPSYYVARQVRRNQESSKLLILTPHNDTVDDILDAVGLRTHLQFFRWLLPLRRNEIQFHLGYPQTARLSTSKDSKPSPRRTPCIIPIPHTGFQPIAHMLSTTSPKNIYQFWLTQTL